MKKLLILAVLGVGSFWAYNKFKKNSSIGYSPNNGGRVPNAAKQGQSPGYPFRAPQNPRVDNSNQPWYFGYRDFTSGPVNSYPSAQTIGAVANAGASVVTSLSDVFGQDNTPTGFTAQDIGSQDSVGDGNANGDSSMPIFTMPDNPFGALDQSGDPTFDSMFAPDGSADPSSSDASQTA